MAIQQDVTVRDIRSTVASASTTNKLIRNTYTLLSMTLIFSAITAGISMTLQLPFWAHLVSSLGSLALIWFVLPRTANSAAGIGVIFVITGLMGFGLGPVLTHYLHLPNGSQIVLQAMGATGALFIGLSLYALTTRKDFSYLGGFLMTGLIVAIIAALANIFLEIPVLSLTISAAITFIMSGFILYDTSRMVNGGETNYIMATIGLYLSIYNLFVSLLQLFGAMSSDD